MAQQGHTLNADQVAIVKRALSCVLELRHVTYTEMGTRWAVYGCRYCQGTITRNIHPTNLRHTDDCPTRDWFRLLDELGEGH